MAFNRVMGFPCERSWWMPKSMGFYSLWVVGEMGYDRVDCILSITNNNRVAVLPDSKLGVRQHLTRATSHLKYGTCS